MPYLSYLLNLNRKLFSRTRLIKISFFLLCFVFKKRFNLYFFSNHFPFSAETFHTIYKSYFKTLFWTNLGWRLLMLKLFRKGYREVFKFFIDSIRRMITSYVERLASYRKTSKQAHGRPFFLKSLDGLFSRWTFFEMGFFRDGLFSRWAIFEMGCFRDGLFSRWACFWDYFCRVYERGLLPRD